MEIQNYVEFGFYYRSSYNYFRKFSFCLWLDFITDECVNNVQSLLCHNLYETRSDTNVLFSPAGCMYFFAFHIF